MVLKLDPNQESMYGQLAVAFRDYIITVRISRLPRAQTPRRRRTIAHQLSARKCKSPRSHDPRSPRPAMKPSIIVIRIIYTFNQSGLRVRSLDTRRHAHRIWRNHC